MTWHWEHWHPHAERVRGVLRFVPGTIFARLTRASSSANSPRQLEPQKGEEVCMSRPPKPLPAGTLAPDFTLHSTPDQAVSLHEFRGQPVILAFYPADWSPVCGD